MINHPNKFLTAMLLLLASIFFNADALAETDAYVRLASEPQQIADLGKTLEEPFVVNVVDQHGNPLAGITVWFDIDYCEPSANGSSCPKQNAYGKFGKADEATAISDRTGRATASPFVAGTIPAQYSVRATIPEQKINNIPIHPHGDPVYFEVTQTPSSLDTQAAGLYYDPKRSGEGWQLTFGTSNGKPTLVATWFTYENGNQIWLSGAGDYAGIENTTDLTMWRTGGAQFGAAFQSTDVKKTMWGTATFHWSDCGHLAISYTRQDGTTGTLNLVRFFYSDNETQCR
jgi:hypothetical protein